MLWLLKFLLFYHINRPVFEKLQIIVNFNFSADMQTYLLC